MKTSELREQAIEALNQTPYIDVETEDEQVFRVWHPLLVDDAAQGRIDRFNANEELDKDEYGTALYPHKINGKLADSSSIRSARAILGPDVHKQFIKAGGHSNDVQLAWNEMVRQQDEEETILGEFKNIEDDDPKSETP